jgi:DNA-binding transcriptional MerR regulator
VEKGPDAFRTISEVADDLDLPQHVLRFWETRFAQIRPMKRGGGRRYYRPEDVDLLRGIRHLLYDEGYTISGVQRILRERGVRQVQAVGQAVLRFGSGTAAEPRDTVPARTAAGLTSVFDYLPSLRAPRTNPAADVQRPAAMADLRDDDLAPIPFRKAQPAPNERVGSAPALLAEGGGTAPALSREAAKALRNALQELGECRRLLDTLREDKP